jgi:hypothetical protein
VSRAPVGARHALAVAFGIAASVYRRRVTLAVSRSAPEVKEFLVISINKSADLCPNEAARYVWGINAKRAARCEYVLAERNQQIVGVFKPTKWQVVSEAERRSIPWAAGLDDTERKCWKYEGCAASPEIMKLYMGRKVPRARGDRSPFRYLTEDDLR